MNHRNRVLGMVALLLIITYLDRVCISVAGPRMQAALGIGPVAWGWVGSVFTLAYGLFEIPMGALGDRIGPRRVLTRIVLWWSAFTTFTGMVTGFYPLLITRFFFGVGEAGAFPNAAIALARWFPVHERGRALGIGLMAGQVGGAIAPLLVVPIQANYGWRASFYAFGILGVVWSLVWYRWYRDSPAEMAGVSDAEREETRGLATKAHHALPWRIAIRSSNLWVTMAVAYCYVYTYSFFQTWFHTFLVKARGFNEHDLLLTSLPYVLGAVANVCGGIASNAMVKRFGLRKGRRSVGAVGLAVASISAAGILLTHDAFLSLVLLCVVYGAIAFQQPGMFAVCLDIGGNYGGTVVGAMNTAAYVGAFTSSLAFGYLYSWTGSYDAPFIPMAVLLLLGAYLWMKVDASEQLVA